MSVKVQNLSKIYGEQHAVNEVSFEAKKGQILGFLGPNGAGKTTTMKMITCFIPQSSGTVEVCGFNTVDSPMEVRQRIGYLPEHNPLYKDMYVREYLSFVAGLHKVANRKSKVEEMIERTGLGREQAKRISSLSKGYRQRVGLAQAMLHDPEVLILDEPTSGLDPNQLIEIRSLIKELGKEKTVIFSTHIMQEVKALCDRVVIIDRGNLVVNDSIDKLQNYIGGKTAVLLEFDKEVTNKKLAGINGVQGVETLGGNRWRLLAKNNQDIRKTVFNFAVQEGLVLLEIQKEVYSVEDVFQHLTGDNQPLAKSS